MGQTASEIAAKYPLVKAYEIRPGILMTASYDKGGQVCEMVLERRHKTDKQIINFDEIFSEQIVKELVNELVPESERGKELKGAYGLENTATLDGQFVVVEYSYENILVKLYGTLRPGSTGYVVAIIEWRKRVCRQQGEAQRIHAKPPGR